jgi:hypothetical protein
MSASILSKEKKEGFRTLFKQYEIKRRRFEGKQVNKKQIALLLATLPRQTLGELFKAFTSYLKGGISHFLKFQRFYDDQYS